VLEGRVLAVAFASATAALETALEARDRSQRALAFVLHTAELGTRASEAPVIERATRIAAAAEGGQVLLTETTAPLVAEAPELRIAVLDLGVHWLAGARSERLHEVRRSPLQMRNES
jgi:hypothetical protein